MSLASLPCNDKIEWNWTISAKIRFFKLSKEALMQPNVRPYSFADIDPADFYNLTYGNSVALQSTLVSLM